MRHYSQNNFHASGPVVAARQSRGKMAYLGGQAAEDSVAAHYERHGYEIAKRRWRGKAGEIDLILRKDNAVIFVEVKKGPDFARAAERLGPRQTARLCRAAEEFIGQEPNGALTDMRIDVGLVDAIGAVEILENALAA